MSSLHPKTIYALTKPNRIDPQFIGIAGKFVEHKRKRQQIQKQHHIVENNLIFAKKTNQQLQKSLQRKRIQLLKCQQMRDRHQDDIKRKLRQQAQRKRKIQQLRMKATFQRVTLKSNISRKLNELKSERKREKDHLKRRSDQLKQQFEFNQQSQLERRHKMYQTIKQEQKQGNRKIDNFYRHRNIQSVHNYRRMIKSEDQKTRMLKQNLESMSRTLQFFNKNNNNKHKKLVAVQTKIEELNPLKSFFSSRLPNSKDQFPSMVKSRVSSLKSIRSKKPIQIILDQCSLKASIDSPNDKLSGTQKGMLKKESQNPQN